MADQRATVTPCRRQVVEYQSAILLRGKATWNSDAQPASPWLCRDGFRQCFREARVGRQGCWSPMRSAEPFRAWRTGGAPRPSRGRVAVSGGDARASSIATACAGTRVRTIASIVPPLRKPSIATCSGSLDRLAKVRFLDFPSWRKDSRRRTAGGERRFGMRPINMDMDTIMTEILVCQEKK